jgi:hypothetical protein
VLRTEELACHLWTWAAMATVFTVSSTISLVITLPCTSTSSHYYCSFRVRLDPGKGKSDFQSETKHGHKFNFLRTRSTTSPPSATCLGQMTPSTRWALSSHLPHSPHSPSYNDCSWENLPYTAAHLDTRVGRLHLHEQFLTR